MRLTIDSNDPSRRTIQASLKTTPRADIAGRVLEFYDRYKEGGLVLREDSQHIWAATHELHFTVEVDGRIVAAAGCFEECDGRYVEIGNTLVATPFRGFGLQRLLVETRAAAALVAYGHEADIITACGPGTRSYANCVAEGFTPWADPPEAFFVLCGRCDKRSAAIARNRRCCCEFLILEPDARNALVRRFLRRGPTSWSRREDGTMLAVGFETRFASNPEFREALTFYADLPPSGRQRLPASPEPGHRALRVAR